MIETVVREQQNGKRELPDGWRWERLGDVCQQDRQIVESGSRLAANLPYLSLEHVESETGRILKEPTEAVEDEGKSTTFVFNANHVLYGKLRPYLNKVALPQWVGRCTTEIVPLLPLHMIDRTFLAWVLRRSETVRAVMQEKTGARMPRADMNSLLDFKIPLPPLPEQKHIAAILNEQMEAIEQARTAAEAQLKAAKSLPDAYLREIFESPEAQQWSRRSLAEVCRAISDGTHFTPIYISEGVPFLSVKDVKETGISFSECRFISEEQHQELCKRCKPEWGDVLYTKVGTTGIAKAIDVNREFSIFVSVALLKLGSDINPEYLEKVLNAPICRVQAATLTQGMANRNLVLKDLKTIEIPLPTLQEQSRIATRLAAILKLAERTRKDLEYQLNAINKLPAAILSQAFNGEL